MPQELADFLAQPFSANMSAARWFLFVGLILAALFSWHLVYSSWTSVEADL